MKKITIEQLLAKLMCSSFDSQKTCVTVLIKTITKHKLLNIYQNEQTLAAFPVKRKYNR